MRCAVINKTGITPSLRRSSLIPISGTTSAPGTSFVFNVCHQWSALPTEIAIRTYFIDCKNCDHDRNQRECCPSKERQEERVLFEELIAMEEAPILFWTGQYSSCLSVSKDAPSPQRKTQRYLSVDL